jgi:subtilisin-like proprotein convertase family protein
LNLFKKILPHRRAIRPALCLLLTISLLGLSSFSSRMTVDAAPAAQESQTPETTHAVFSNPSGISPADRLSNNGGTNPGLPSLYPSPVTVSGLTGVVSKVTVAFQMTSTFPDDLDILLVGPNGANAVIMSDAGGSGDHVGVGIFFDQTAATFIQDEGTTPVPTNVYKPSNFSGAVANEPTGGDNFPTPAPGLQNYGANLDVFNGTNPNGQWKLYVVDDAVSDLSSLTNGWSLDITTAPAGNCTAAKRPIDMNGDGKTDYQVVRTTGGQSTWYTLVNGGGVTATQWGSTDDKYLPADYDGDGKADIAVWRGGSPANFYILQSATNTLRIESFGLTGDNPTVIGDYDGDGKTDIAVYRPGVGPAQSVWYYKSSINGTVQSAFWGVSGDFPIPGDFDGDGKYDNTVQRNIGGGQGAFYRRLSGGGVDGVQFGTPTDPVVPGYYDGDCKQDLAVLRSNGSNIVWYVLYSTDGSVHGYAFGSPGPDYPAQGDYDGDGKTDIAVWRPDNNASGQAFFFYLRSSDGAFTAQNWGLPVDTPTAHFNTH